MTPHDIYNQLPPRHAKSLRIREHNDYWDIFGTPESRFAFECLATRLDRDWYDAHVQSHMGMMFTRVWREPYQ